MPKPGTKQPLNQFIVYDASADSSQLLKQLAELLYVYGDEEKHARLVYRAMQAAWCTPWTVSYRDRPMEHQILIEELVNACNQISPPGYIFRNAYTDSGFYGWFEQSSDV